jgi:hypothetical protein
MKQHTEALTAFVEALALARAVGHRQHQADLLWSLGLAHAELGQRDQALAQAQAAATLMQEMGNPQAAIFAGHLQRYRAGGSGAPPALPPGDSVKADRIATQPGSPPAGAAADGPGRLRMALSAARSMGRFVGSGFKTTPPWALQQRLQACATCPQHTGVRCRLCGCFTKAKARLAHEGCPIGKWAE